MTDTPPPGIEGRLRALDELLPTLAGALDVREVFERVSSIAQQVLPHDFIALPLVSDDRQHATLYARAAASGSVSEFPETILMPEKHRALLDSGWDHYVYHDIQKNPTERETPPGRAGFRSILRLAVNVQGRLAAVLDFGSMTPGFYTEADAVVGRRIADCIALALAHQRLADQAREVAALRAREASLDMLDGLMTTLAGVLDIRDVFDQVSAVAGRVIAHDLMTVVLPTDDGQALDVFAVAGSVRMPKVARLPSELKAVTDGHWDHLISADAPADPRLHNSEPALAGYRSMLAIQLRLRGETLGAVGFWSRQPDVYRASDVLPARRIADHVVLALSHQRLAQEAQRSAAARARADALEARVKSMAAELNAVTGYRRVVGQSRGWQNVLKQATQVAATETTVLLLGESGTGKEVVARFIHRASGRSGGPFVALNCAALPEPLLESELFGYERGAFTGATQSKPGQLEQAAGGVLFLDEVGEMSPPAQAKFLRVLQEREFQRLGGTRALKANVRVVAATNRDLRSAIERGAFREDLYYRLHVFEIHLPPLRERSDDVLPLSEAFLEDISRALGRPPAGISREARDALVGYPWPGNVRELRNTLERAAILCEGGLITREHLTLSAPRPRPAAAAGAVEIERPHGSALADTTDLRILERSAIKKALEDAKFNKSQAARSLGLTRKQLYVRLRQHGLE